MRKKWNSRRQAGWLAGLRLIAFVLSSPHYTGFTSFANWELMYGTFCCTRMHGRGWVEKGDLSLCLYKLWCKWHSHGLLNQFHNFCQLVLHVSKQDKENIKLNYIEICKVLEYMQICLNEECSRFSWFSFSDFLWRSNWKYSFSTERNFGHV